MRHVPALYPARVVMAHKRLRRLRDELADLEHSEPTDATRKAIQSKRVAIKRWEDILAQRPIY